MPEQMLMRWEPVLPREQPRGSLDVTWRWKVRVGRAKECEVTLKHESIPRHQGNFMRLRNHWWVEDLHSDNGIYIRGKRIHLEPVNDDAVDFSMMVRFRIEKTPMSSDELRLRAAIYAEPADDSRFLVYADWLLERGEPLGSLMVSPGLIGESWLGPLFSPGLGVTWRHGFLDAVVVRSAKSVYGKTGIFEEILTHPLAAFLRTLEVDAVLLAAESDHVPAEKWVDNLFEALRPIAPPTLRSLRVRLPTEQRLRFRAEYEELKARHPGLATRWELLFTEGALG